MNQVTEPESFRLEPLSAESIAAARAHARATGTRVIDVLESALALPPAEFMRRQNRPSRNTAVIGGAR